MYSSTCIAVLVWHNFRIMSNILHIERLYSSTMVCDTAVDFETRTCLKFSPWNLEEKVKKIARWYSLVLSRCIIRTKDLNPSSDSWVRARVVDYLGTAIWSKVLLQLVLEWLRRHIRRRRIFGDECSANIRRISGWPKLAFKNSAWGGALLCPSAPFGARGHMPHATCGAMLGSIKASQWATDTTTELLRRIVIDTMEAPRVDHNILEVLK